MHVGIDSFVSTVTDPSTGRVIGPEERIEHLLEEIAHADASGVYSFGIGEHHREEYYDSAPPILLAAAAARTSRIRLGSAVTGLSAADPVRVFQQFATLDLIAKGRIDLVVGRGSFTEAFPLFGLDLSDYDSLFTEKLDLLLKIRDSARVTWTGRHPRPPPGPLARPPPPPPHGAGRLPSAGPEPAADLGRRRRHAELIRPGRQARTAAHGRHHRRRAPPVRATGRSLPPGRRRGRTCSRDPASRPARLRLRRRR